MAVRGVFAVALMLVILPWLGLRIGWPERYTWLRAAGEVAVTFTFLAALARLPIGDTYTLYFAGPLLLTAGAALLLGEQVGPRRWAAVLVGFLGVLVVLGLPREWQAASLIALLAAFLSVARDLTTRWIPAAVGSGTVAALTSVCVTSPAGPPRSAATGSGWIGTTSACARWRPSASPAATPRSWWRCAPASSPTSPPSATPASPWPCCWASPSGATCPARACWRGRR